MSPDHCSCTGANAQPSPKCVATPASERVPEPHVAVPARANLRDFMAITKALADEQRVRALMALQRGELCVCQIVELLGLATSTVSKHMSILKQARLVESRKHGRWMYYRLADDDATDMVRQTVAWAAVLLMGDPQVLKDRQRLAAICTSDPSELCVAQVSGKRTCP